MTMNTFGISSYQRLLIGCALDPDVPDSFHSSMTLSWAYRVTPALNKRTLKRALTSWCSAMTACGSDLCRRARNGGP